MKTFFILILCLAAATAQFFPLGGGYGGGRGFGGGGATSNSQAGSQAFNRQLNFGGGLFPSFGIGISGSDAYANSASRGGGGGGYYG
ncbi:hypothetical protein FF38_05277 [Lucilia cuprina]|uniref:Uncharacterized protein n=1 Tax=Lucilia cuprina TaxID=7375 RepID=A0A0L0BXQ6_LUCCU|nr:hypothetical protein FF38_05277 [Lucilia cuprina]